MNLEGGTQFSSQHFLYARFYVKHEGVYLYRKIDVSSVNSVQGGHILQYSAIMTRLC